MGKASDFYEGFKKYTPTGRIVGAVFPDDPKKVTDTPAYQKTDAFATGLGNERANYTSATPTISEGTAPGLAPPSGFATGMNWRNQTGAAEAAKRAVATQYADPTGADAQKRALALSEAAANGNAPSQAEQLFRKGIDEGTASQLGIAATLQGSNPGMALRSGLQGAAAVERGSAADAAALRADEMAKARGEFANVASTTRGQTQDLAKANQDAALRQQLIDNQYKLGLSDQQLRALLGELGGDEKDIENKNNFDLGQQAFWGNLGSSAAKGAAGGAPK